jgi:hypothetical protein
MAEAMPRKSIINPKKHNTRAGQGLGPANWTPPNGWEKGFQEGWRLGWAALQPEQDGQTSQAG